MNTTSQIPNIVSILVVVQVSFDTWAPGPTNKIEGAPRPYEATITDEEDGGPPGPTPRQPATAHNGFTRSNDCGGRTGGGLQWR